MSGTWNSDLQVPKPSPYRLSYCRPNKHCFRGCMCLQRDWGIFPENNGCLECLAPLTAHTVPYRKWLMCREEVRAATISSTASCREERRTGRIEVQMIKELRVETWMWDFDSVCLFTACRFTLTDTVVSVLIFVFWSSSRGQRKKGVSVHDVTTVKQVPSFTSSNKICFSSVPCYLLYFRLFTPVWGCWVQLSHLDLVYVKAFNLTSGTKFTYVNSHNLFKWSVFYEKFRRLCSWIAVGLFFSHV